MQASLSTKSVNQVPWDINLLKSEHLRNDLSYCLQSAAIIPVSSTYDDYLGIDFPKDLVSEEPVDPYSTDNSSSSPVKQARFLVVLHQSH